jgi:hypothetical protein
MGDCIGETCLPFSHYRYLWLSSWTAFASALYGSAMGHPYDVIATPANIFLTSMLYWHYPVHNTWRYYLDVFTTHAMILYAVYRAYNAEYMWYTYAVWTGVPLFNALWGYYYKNGQYDASVFFHALLHICGNVGCFVLFSGHVKPLLGDIALEGDGHRAPVQTLDEI